MLSTGQLAKSSHAHEHIPYFEVLEEVDKVRSHVDLGSRVDLAD